jgi:hypothetical protein
LVDKARFNIYIERLSDEDIGRVESALRQVIGL